MSRETIDQIPIIPETEVIEPIVQCGVLYLGTAPPSPGRRGIDSVQEPLAHRYPVDGTNTVQGIDAILSIYDNGLQLTFARQPHVVIFFPISSLIYCASLRFSVVENDQTSLIDWRFVTLDSTEPNQSKHPPLFCAVIQRTQILTGDECHCFLTKSDDAALALVRTISEVYGNLPATIKSFRSPIFYQLDRYGRKISETTGIIYLSPATKDDSQIDDYQNSSSTISRHVLLDPTLDGFFYRTDSIIIEKWQLWDDDDLTGSRPRPPASPFGQRQGLYHDDLTDELNRSLRLMQDEDRASTCSCSSSSTDSEQYRRRHRSRSKSRHRTEQFNTSSFDPSSTPTTPIHMGIKKAPIIIEKVVANPLITKPRQYAIEQPFQPLYNHPMPIQQPDEDYNLLSDSYQINDRGEKITNEGNRILFMDVIQPTVVNNKLESKPYKAPKLHRKRQKHIPVLDLRSVENLFQEKQSKYHRKNKLEKKHQNLSTSDMLEIVEGYFEDYKGRKLKLDGDDAQTMLEHFESSNPEDHQEIRSAERKTRRRRSHSKLIAGPSLNYVERSAIRLPSIETEQEIVVIESNNEELNEYVSNIYESTEKVSPSPSPIIPQESQPPVDPNTMTPDYLSPFRYMQSSVNPLLFREYRNAFNGVQ